MAARKRHGLYYEIENIYKSQGVRDMRLLDHAKALKIAAKATTDPKKSQALRNTLGRFVSDFFERAQFKPLTKGQKQQFSFPASAPDSIASLEEVAQYLPKGAADPFLPTLATKQFEGEQGALLPIEFKQTLGAGGTATTATQMTATFSKSQFANIFGLDEQERKLLQPGVSLEGKDNSKLRKQFNTAFTGANFKKWMFSSNKNAQAYKADVVTQLTEKIANYEVINWSDKKGKGTFPTIYLVPGADKILKIKNESDFNKYVTVSPNKDKTKVDSDGNVSIVVQFKINNTGGQVLEEHALDITTKVHARLSETGSSELMNFIALQAGRKKYDVNYLTEIIAFAKDLMANPFLVESKNTLADVGVITKGVTFKPEKAAARVTKRPTMQKAMSSIQLTATIQRSLRARMPKGPVGGPPLSNEMLTNRTGRFISSVGAEIRGSLINYFYNPIYQVHESTSRRPGKTIEESIRNIIRSRMGNRPFRIIRRV